MNWKPTEALVDILVVVAVGITAFLISVEFDTLEWIVLQVSRYENHEIDEFIFTLNVIALCLGVFSYRRWREVSLAKKIIQKRNEELEKAFNEIETLKGILPICSFCNKIRDDKGSWRRLDAYLEEKMETRFSHSLCSDCLKEHYPEFAQAEDSSQKSST